MLQYQLNTQLQAGDHCFHIDPEEHERIFFKNRAMWDASSWLSTNISIPNYCVELREHPNLRIRFGTSVIRFSFIYVFFQWLQALASRSSVVVVAVGQMDGWKRKTQKGVLKRKSLNCELCVLCYALSLSLSLCSTS